MNKNPKISCAIGTKYQTTDILVKVYKNRIFIVATDYKKLGKFVSVTREESVTDFDTTAYAATPIFGGALSSYLAAAKYIAESIEIDRPLLISIDLSGTSKSVLDQIIAAIKKLKTW